VARNIEIKVRIGSVEAFAPVVANLADQDPIEMVQDDTFFNCDAGRLKLRSYSPHQGELIFYQRSDQSGPKESFYLISRTAEPDSLRAALSLAYGQAGRVRKHRTLYIAGRTRVHLDRVEGLGHFLELEVVLADGEPVQSGVEIAQHLMARLDIDSGQLIEGAYIDLLDKKLVP